MKNNTPLIVAIILALMVLAVLIVFCLKPWEPRSVPEETVPSGTTDTIPAASDIPETTEPSTSAPFVPEIHPDVVGIYIPAEDGTKDRKRISEFVSQRTAGGDIDCFEVFASAEDKVSGASFAKMWKETWEQHENTENAKIGYAIQLTLQDGSTVYRVIRKPGDAADIFDFVEVYIYDDINQTPGVRYTHIEDSQINEDTILSSIKLTGGVRIHEVGDILLTAFIYTGDDCFDADGNYIGVVSANVLIREE